MRTFRFGYQANPTDAADLRAKARAAEAAGFDVVHTGDHVSDGWPPLASIMGMAEVTERIRFCPLVLNHDWYHPVHLAREVAAMDHLTGGRLELGIGAGHSFTEYAAIGARFDPPAVRKARMAEAVEILRGLLDGDEVTHHGEHYQIERVRTLPAVQPRLPLLVGVNGRTALAHAARHADAIGLTMLGRTLADGQRHEARWEPDGLDRAVAWVQEQAGDRWPDLELNVLVQAVVVTEDRRAAAEAIVERVPGLEVQDALVTPFLAIGTHDEIAEQLLANRRRWGISYVSVREIDSFAPVIDRMRDADEREASGRVRAT